MKPRTTPTHEAPELMREFGAEVLEERRVYGGRTARRKRHVPRLRPRKTAPRP